MKTNSSSTMFFVAKTTLAARTFFFAVLLAAGTVASAAQAQGELSSGTISGSGSGPYNYSLTFSNASNASLSIGSVWYAWIPGSFYLPGVPTSAFAPAGWTATISGNSVQFVANSSGNDITAGHSLSGFGYQASFSPAQLAAAANSGVSVAYSAGLLSGTANTFTVLAAPVPEPTSMALLFFMGMVFIFARRKIPSAGRAVKFCAIRHTHREKI